MEFTHKYQYHYQYPSATQPTLLDEVLEYLKKLDDRLSVMEENIRSQTNDFK